MLARSESENVAGSTHFYSQCRKTASYQPKHDELARGRKTGRMNTNSTFLNAFALADRVIGSVFEYADPGMVLSIDIGESLFDFIISNAAALAGHDFVSSPSLLRYRSRLLGLGLPLKPSSVITEPVVFGRIDGHIKISDGNDPLESYGSCHDEIAIRSIDSWLTGRPGLRLVHFGDPELALDQMAGAREAIARDRPILTLYPARQSRRVLESVLESLGYQAFNLGAEPVHSHENAHGVGFGWIALPNERRTGLGLAEATESHARGEDFAVAPWHLSAGHDPLPRQRRSHAIFGLSASGELPMARTIGAADIIAVNDCYPAESEDCHSWRWLGPSARSRVAVPVPLPGVYRTELSVLGLRTDGGLSDCRIIVDGREVRTSASKSPPGTIEFDCHVEPMNYSGYMEIDIVSPGVPQIATDDSRILRLSIQSITVSRLQQRGVSQ
jgi:hypothetical protein